MKTKSVLLLCKEWGERTKTQHMVPALQEFMVATGTTNTLCDNMVH